MELFRSSLLVLKFICSSMHYYCISEALNIFHEAQFPGACWANLKQWVQHSAYRPPTNPYSAEWGIGSVLVYQQGQTHLVQVISAQGSANALLPKRTGALQVCLPLPSSGQFFTTGFRGHGGNMKRGSVVKTDLTGIICDWFCKAYLDHWRG